MAMERIGPHGLAIVGVRRDGRRRYDPASKERLIEASLRPGVSLASLARQHGLNANLLHKWVARRQQEGAAKRPVTSPLPDAAAFVRVEMAALPTASGGEAMAIGPVMPARMHVKMPNGVTLSLEGCDAPLLATMIAALGRLDVPTIG